MTTRTYPNIGVAIRESSLEKAQELQQILGTPSVDVAVEVALHYALVRIKEDVVLGKIIDNKRWFTFYNFLQEREASHA